MTEVTWESDYSDVRVYINGLLHVHFIRSRYIGCQAYYNGSKVNKIYVLELFLEGATIKLEYDNKETWVEMLKQFGENI